ncbi:hypothetical protein ABZY90_19745 [Streptomyces sp. NPDC006422]|uniref:hypothetical protein n=1 Tax=unclassified Streptomyces TaxID=2593676 RepID=UPI0033A2E09B
MATRRRRRAPPPEPPPGGLLNWNSNSHWDFERELPCRYCGVDTQLRDSKRKPAHKICAEEALARQAAEAADAYQIGSP